MNRDQIVEIFKRYSHGIDDLLRIEMDHVFHSSSEEDRIEMIKISNDQRNGAYMPDEWAELVLKEGSRSEKIALAKFATNPNVRLCDMQYSPEYKKIGKDLSELLLDDNDQLIKCALYENPDFLPILSSQIEIFKNASFVERLALVRNPQIELKDIMQKIYDPNNSDFGLDDNQRVMLISAFCRSEIHIQRNRQLVPRSLSEYSNFMDAVSDRWGLASYGELWDLALKWEESPRDKLSPSVAYMTFKVFLCPLDKMLEVYKKLKTYPNQKEGAELRRSIFYLIQSLALEKHQLKKFEPLLKEGLLDEDGKEESDEMFKYSIRGIAHSLLPENEEKVHKQYLELTSSAISRTRKFFSYSWQVISGLITFAIILGIFFSADTKFESIVFSLLALIYLSIVNYFSWNGFIQTSQWHTEYDRYKHIRKLLKEELSDDDKSSEDRELYRIKKEWEHNQVKFYINAAFNFIFYLVVILNLLGASARSY